MVFSPWLNRRKGRKMLRFLLVFLTLWAVSVTGAGPARADRLEGIQKRGALIVGVKTDYPPFGMLDAGGGIVGFEADLAANIAFRLGVELRLVGVTAANRLQKLEDGSVDIIIATMGDTAERRRIATLIEPSYYASGANVLVPPGKTFRAWSDLRGQKVCATQGSLYNRNIAQRQLLELQVFNGARDAKLALKDGRCVAWLYDDTAIAGDLLNPEWAGYSMPLTSSLLTPWSMAIAAAERGGKLERLLSDTVAEWHRSGFLLEAEKRWKLKPSPFLAQNNRLWSEKRSDGTPVCTRRAAGEWPTECRIEALAVSADAEGLQKFGLLLKERTGLDLSVVYDSYDREQFIVGLLITVKLAAACLLGSLLIGFVGALAVEARWPLISPLVEAAATVGRMTPPLLQIYVIFFGVGGAVVTRFGWTVDGFLVAAGCLSLYAGSANVFAFVEAAGVLRGRDPAYRLGLRRAGPAFKLAFGALSASLVNIVKATGMASAIAVPELISASTAIMAERGNIAVMMNVLMIVYFLLILAVVRLLNTVERKVMRHDAA
jgi:polar amino acid transport system substrate-binding protein